MVPKTTLAFVFGLIRLSKVTIAQASPQFIWEFTGVSVRYYMLSELTHGLIEQTRRVIPQK